MHLDHGVYFSSIPSTDLANAMKSLTKALSPTASATFMTSSSVSTVVQPTVYLTNETQVERAIAHVIADFSLNEEQSQAFQIVAHHSLDTTEDPQKQLLMGLFGEAGTGKSRLVDAIKAWFSLLNRSAELIVTATTGAAAFNIWGSTIHSVLGITIEWGDKTRKMGFTKKKEWRDRWYLIIDKVSMLDCKLMSKLHKKLSSAKPGKDKINFGGVNIIFLGDFLQLPSVSRSRLYINNPKWQHGYDLWHALNAVVILYKQMRQAEDPDYSQLLGRMRIRNPTNEDISILHSLVGAPLPDPTTVPIVVQRHRLRHALNIKRVHSLAESSATPIVYCVAKVTKRNGMSLPKVYGLRLGHKRVLGDAILPLLPGTPLMITTNINTPLGTHPFS